MWFQRFFFSNFLIVFWTKHFFLFISIRSVAQTISCFSSLKNCFKNPFRASGSMISVWNTCRAFQSMSLGSLDDYSMRVSDFHQRSFEAFVILSLQFSSVEWLKIFESRNHFIQLLSLNVLNYLSFVQLKLLSCKTEAVCRWVQLGWSLFVCAL